MKKGNIGAAAVLILVGVWFLALELFPSLKGIVYGDGTWPLSIIGVGLLLALVGLFIWNPQMLIPACIVGGIGGLLYYQNATGDWGSWSYAWALIPGFVGMGIFLAGLLSRKRGEVAAGLWQILISLVLFVVFASFLGGPAFLGRYWPAGLIVLGLILLVRSFTRRAGA